MRPNVSRVGAIVLLACSALAACDEASQTKGTIPSRPFAIAPKAAHFLPFVGTCVQSGSTCMGGSVQLLTQPTTISKGINYPYALKYDKLGNLYVANYIGNSVTVYAPGATKPKKRIVRHISYPDDLAFDNKTGVLFVANNCNVQLVGACSGSNTVTAYRRGEYLYTLGSKARINQPVALAADSDGHLYVANAGSNQVTEYDSKTRSLMRTLLAKGVTDLRVGKGKHLFVASNRANKVQEYTASGTIPIRTINVPEPFRLTVDKHGNLYVGTPSAVYFYCYPRCRNPGLIINDVHVAAMAIDPDDNLYVADGGLTLSTQNVEEYAPHSTTPSMKVSFDQTLTALAINPQPVATATPTTSPSPTPT